MDSFSTKPRAGSKRFLVEGVQESSKGNGHSFNLDEIKASNNDGMTQVDLKGATNSVADPSAVDISEPGNVFKAPREIKLKLFAIFLFLLIIAGTTCILLLYTEPPLHYKVGRLTFYVDSRLVRVSYRGSNYTHSTVGMKIPNVIPSTCAATTDRRLCLEWGEYGQLEIDWLELENMDCYDFTWTALQKDITHKDCLSLQNAHWYGSAVVPNQAWPFTASDMPSQPYLSGDGSSPFGPIAEHYWLSSNGLGLRLNNSLFIYMSMDGNSQELCLEAGQYLYAFQANNSARAMLQYTMCLASNLTAVHRNMSNRFVARTKELPDSYVIANPTWSVAVPADKSWNDSLLVDTARSLSNLGYNSGMFEIPGSYAAFEGSLEFDEQRFGSVSETMRAVTDLKFKPAVQVTPYCSTESPMFLEGEANGYWVKDPRNLVPGLTKWRDGLGSILDVTSDSAVNWFKNNIQKLRDGGVSNFTFDYGQASYLPVGFNTEESLDNPDDFVNRYVSIADELQSPVVRSAYQCQHIPLVAEFVAKDLNWEYENGLKTIIPTALTMGLQGYPFFMPDLQFMPSGCSNPVSCLPEKELFIRYIEISAFLPAMQIPTILLAYDNETKSIVKDWVDFHSIQIAPLIFNLARDFSERGDPVIRPMWWTVPTDPTALRIDSQFMVGDDLLVAPILDPGATQREVYLPEGSWEDNEGNRFSGGQWLSGVPVLLSKVAYYNRVQ